METLGKIIFYLSNLALYHLLMWWGVNTLCVGVVAAGFEYWILFAVLVFLGISTFSYLLAHYFWNSSYWGMFLKNAGMFLLALFVTYLRMMFYDL
ncbi:hypothetical protein ACRASQ_20315 [Bacteroides hominis]|uniref:hypothetical protein n=1 Tax=Bacteroides TaxID=816 RepID=UPI00202FDBE6|nr:hypothetical protein [Bacteroides fragilis]MCM0217700.1 hypothetical protein [Bacteroides fragilis]MCM0266207.1 hypothetical protein [Bacteroides fragilis]